MDIKSKLAPLVGELFTNGKGSGMSRAVSKKERAAREFRENLQVYQCPICSSAFLSNEGGIQCGSGHFFNFARKGYLNLLMGAPSTHYSKDLFSARKNAFAHGIYDPLVDQVAALVEASGLQRPYGVDAGCGEGSFLARIQRHLAGARLIGIDISRDGIQLASTHEQPIMWCVADLAELPLAAGSMDIVFNILSPANYDEFRRVLKPDGILIKVLPGEEYLREIRLQLEGIHSYSNQEVVAKLRENLEIQRHVHLRYQVPLSMELWQLVIEMTPLTWHRQPGAVPPSDLTLDLELIEARCV